MADENESPTKKVNIDDDLLVNTANHHKENPKIPETDLTLSEQQVSQTCKDSLIPDENEPSIQSVDSPPPYVDDIAFDV